MFFLRVYLYLAMHKQPRNFISCIPRAMDMPMKVCFKYFASSDILASIGSLVQWPLPTEKNLEPSRTSVRKQPKTHIKQFIAICKIWLTQKGFHNLLLLNFNNKDRFIGKTWSIGVMALTKIGVFGSFFTMSLVSQ